MMKRVSLAVLQLALLSAGMAGFFALTPWLGCRPLDRLPREGLVPPPPSDARCFTYSHGEVRFHSHGLIAEEPVLFALHVLAFAIPVLALIWLVLWKPSDAGR
jgi:hypothetical protein